MSDTITASGFNRDWDGEYTRDKYRTLWVHETELYFIWRDSYFWYLSSSQYKYSSQYLKARRAVDVYTSSEDVSVHISDPVGSYTGVNGNPNGVVS